jgi:hypothetical protein
LIDNLMRRRLALLWQQYSRTPEGTPFVLDGEQVARDAGNPNHYADTYYNVLLLDIDLLTGQDRAAREATDHPSYELQGITPYWLTDDGRRL